MDVFEHVKSRLDLIQSSRFSLELLRDSVRLARSRYVAQSLAGTCLELEPGRGEWFTFYENVIRKRKFHQTIPLEPGDCVIDIGANIGAFTVVAASQVGPTGRVFAYEPDPLIAERLRHNVELNRLHNVEVFASAIGGENGHARLHRHKKSAFSSLLDGVDGREHQHTEAFEVDIVGMRDVIERCGGPVQLVKMDCEGAEYAAFDALQPKTAQRIRQITMEVHHVPDRSIESLMERLHTLGFDVQPGYPLLATRRDSTKPTLA